MLIDISNIRPEGLVLEGQVPLEGFPLEGGLRARLSPPRLVARLEPGARGLRLAGHFDTRVVLTCVRCLERFEMPLSRDFELTVVRTQDPTARPPGPGRPRDAAHGASEDDMLAVDGSSLDMVDVIREQVDLSLPMNPVCRTECRGLCGRCGARRDAGACGCPDDSADPRWDALRAWKKTKPRS